jgi:hypothetical protein
MTQSLDIIKNYIILCQTESDIEKLLANFAEDCEIIDNRHKKKYVGKNEIIQYYKSNEKTWIVPKIKDPITNDDETITLVLIFKKLGLTIKTVTLNVKFSTNSSLFEQIIIN